VYVEIERRQLEALVTGLQTMWLETLAATACALNAATRIHALASADARARSERLAAERRWVQSVDWLKKP
jgi:hypothetical protein